NRLPASRWNGFATVGTGRTGEISELIGDQRAIGARLADGLAVVERLDSRYLAALVLDAVGDLGEQALASRPVGVGPLGLVGLPRGVDRTIDVVAVACLCLGEHFPGRGIARLERLARSAFDPFAADVEVVRLGEQFV